MHYIQRERVGKGGLVDLKWASWLRTKKRASREGSLSERGFTLLEVTVSMFVGTLLLSLMVTVFVMASQKTGYIAGDSELVRFEQLIGTWFDSDFRENRVMELDKTRFDEGRIQFKLEDGEGKESTVVYENRQNGYYRVKDAKAVFLSSQRIERVALVGNVLELTYYLENVNKTIRIKLVK